MLSSRTMQRDIPRRFLITCGGFVCHKWDSQGTLSLEREFEGGALIMNPSEIPLNLRGVIPLNSILRDRAVAVRTAVAVDAPVKALLRDAVKVITAEQDGFFRSARRGGKRAGLGRQEG